MTRRSTRALAFAGSFLAAAVLVSAAPAAAAPAVRAARAKAVTIRPLSLFKVGDLSFGNVVPGTTAGTVTVNPVTDAATYTGTAAAAGGTITAARFVGAGSANQLVWVTWSTAPVTLSRIGGGATMQMDQLTTNSVLFVFSGADPRIIPADRTLDIRFGARLLVGANQREGDYQGSFAVTVDYP